MNFSHKPEQCAGFKFFYIQKSKWQHFKTVMPTNDWTIHLRLQQIWQIFEPSLPADCWRLKWMGPNINCLPISKIWLMTFYCFEALWTKILPPVSVLFSLALYMLWKLEVWYVLCYNKTVWLMTIAWSRTWAHVTGLISYQNEALNPKSVESANPPITITYEIEQEERKAYTVSSFFCH